MLNKVACSIGLCVSLLACSGENSSQLASSSPRCNLSPLCTQGMPTLPAPVGFADLYKKAISRFGSPLHRGRDTIVTPGQDIWIQAKFTYSPLDSDLKHEAIDIYLSQGCNSALKRIGQTITTLDGEHETTEGVDDTGGRIYAKLSDFGIQSLPIGRHRIVLVVPADNSSTDLYIEVVKAGSSIVVSDVDGTLTSSELAAASEFLGKAPTAHPGAAEALTILYNKGYPIVYLTARPEWFMTKTREWLQSNKFPPGMIRTTQSKVGANGAQAEAYKTDELARLQNENGLVVSYAFGNKESDVAAFSNSGIDQAHSYFYELVGDAGRGNIFADYKDLLPALNNTPTVCR